LIIENRNIVCIASNWFYDPTSKHHVMRILAERNHVVWVNYHGSRRPRASAADARAIVGKLRQFVEGPRRVAENITVLTPLVAPLPGVPGVARLNRRLLTRQIRAVLRGLPRRPAQLWSFAPDVDFLCGAFDEECVVYYCVDEFSEFGGYDAAAVLAAERRLAERADLVVATSTPLLEKMRTWNKNTLLVTHGVDYEHFAGAGSSRQSHGQAGLADAATTKTPNEMRELPRPVLGFWGLIQDWVDVELLAGVARMRPAWSIVLIGEVATDVSGLRGLPNVHVIGRRVYADLPAYAGAMDIGLIPFRLNNLTRAVNPIKLREYLSAGLPVVSTPLPEVERYGHLVRTAEGVEAFVRACENEMEGNSIERANARRGAMAQETWREKVGELSEAVERVMSARVLKE